MIARLTNAAYLEHPALREFMLHALRTDPLIERPALALKELESRLSDASCGVYVGADDAEAKALLVVDANKSEFSRAVVVIHIYNRGGTRMLRDLFRAMEVFKDEHQLSRVHGVDINQRPRAYCRLFRLGGWRPRPVGMFYQFSEA